MKRFRILGFDLDARVHSLTLEIQDNWEENVKGLHKQNKRQTEDELVWEFGEASAEQKRQNFIDLGLKPISILAFHNEFFQQIRISFVMGAYYPSLTASCALGERILNHLILTVRDEFKTTSEYKQVYRKDSFNWDTAINILAAWQLLLPEVVVEFRKLCKRRNEAIHFRPEVDKDARTPALCAIGSLGSILGNQFSAFGSQPWFIPGIPGEAYIKKNWEPKPFIQKIYLPNCLAVGPRHEVDASVIPWAIKDNYPYEEREVTDEEFCVLRLAGRDG